MSWNRNKQSFLEEGRELLWVMEDTLLRMESRGGSAEEEVKRLHLAVRAFREAVEFFGCTHLLPFARVVENRVDKIVDYEIAPTGKLITNLFLCCDLLHGLVNHLAHQPIVIPHGGILDGGGGNLINYFTSLDETALPGGRGARGSVGVNMCLAV